MRDDDDWDILAAYYRGAHVIIGVFDMNNLETLTSAERWINEALEITAADNPIVFLVGSKQDLIVRKNNLHVFRLMIVFNELVG